MKTKKKKRGKGLLTFFLLILFIIFVVYASDCAFKQVFPQKYSNYVEKYSAEYGLNKYFVYSLIKAESNFDSQAVSPRNAKGLMQILDSTGEWAATKIKIEDFDSSMLLEPDTNIRIGCWYISKLLTQYDQNVELALSAYNAGSGNVAKWLNDLNISSDGKTLDRIPFEETDKYIKKIKRYNYIYKKLYG